MSYTQQNRRLILTTPLGKDVLMAEQVTGVEALSQPFQFDILCLADSKTKVDPQKVLGQAVTLEIGVDGSAKRAVHGVVRRVRQGSVDEVFASYELQVVPQFALLDYTADCRIFQAMSIPDVVQAVLKEGGVKVKTALTATYDPLDYCVQYRETDFAFVSRLLEQEGITYFFEHDTKGHVMVLSDKSRNASANAHHAEIEYGAGNLLAPRGSITAWDERRELFPGSWTMRDFHFEKPRASLEVSVPALKPADATKSLEMFDFPGGYAQRFNKPGERLGKLDSTGEALDRTRMERAESGGHIVDGTSTCAGLLPGTKFSVKSLGNQRVSGSWVLQQVMHRAQQQPSLYGDEHTAPDGGYQNTFVAMPVDATYRPPRTIARPSVQGLQSARVIDESQSGDTEEIWPDKYGRVRVRFPWDREGKSACWVRVAQVRAGKTGGFQWIPRVGDEVLVAFLEGDPDCPVIVGSVYNAENMPPYALPANKTQSGLRTRSSPKGGQANANELRFEDKKGSEHIFLQAEKDWEIEVKNDEKHHVVHDRIRNVDNDETVTVKHDQTLTVTNDRTVKVDGKQTHTVKGDHTLTVSQGKHAVTVDKGDHTLAVKTGNHSVKVDKGNQDIEVAMGNQTTKIKMGNQTTTLDLGNAKTECKVGNITIKAAAGAVKIEGLQGIELKVGPNSIKIDMSGIKISGLQVATEGKLQNEMKGLMCKVDAQAMLMAKGAITMLG